MNRRSETGDRLQRRRDGRKREILAAAERVFGSQGYHEASLQEVAAAAGLAVGTLYLYFADKAELYGTILVEKMKLLLETVSAALEAHSGAADRLAAAIQAQFRFHDTHRRFFEIFLHQDQLPASSLHARHWKEMENLKRQLRERIEGVVRLGQVKGEIREGSAELFASAWLGITIQIIRQSVRQKTPGPLARLAPEAAAFFLHGAAALPPSL